VQQADKSTIQTVFPLVKGLAIEPGDVSISSIKMIPPGEVIRFPDKCRL